MSNINDFMIRAGVLMLYKGNDVDVVIPDGVTIIGYGAFEKCESLTSITIPEGVTEIEKGAFQGCERLKSITIPGSVTKMGSNAFFLCGELENIKILGDVILEKDHFGGYSIPVKLKKNLGSMHNKISEQIVREYIVECKQNWDAMDTALKTEIFLTRHSKTLDRAYANAIDENDADTIAQCILTLLPNAASVKECNNVSICMDILADKANAEHLQKMHAWLKEQKNAKKALVNVEGNIRLADVLGKKTEVDESIPMAEQIIIKKLNKEKLSEKAFEEKLKAFYGIVFKDLPPMKYKDGRVADSRVLAYLLMVHEELVDKCMRVKGNTPEISGEAREILEFIDTESFKEAIAKISEKLESGYSKKMYLAYPVCRYADTELMAELVKKAPTWRSKVSGNDAPMLRTFRKAICYNNSQMAMLFADKYNDLDEYAQIRGMDADSLRDRYLSDVGLDENGCKKYDLGNQTVTAKLMKDMSFIVELSDGKKAKSIPKKGADEELYAVANADFAEMKKTVKKIVKNRQNQLFKEFLSGKARKADAWKTAYLRNPLLRSVASLIVWTQGENTFTLCDNKAITPDGADYVIGEGDITVSHPMDMNREIVTLWQKYFIEKDLKQPFEQVWEAVIDPNVITKDRYKDCMIPYYRFSNQKKHGIVVAEYDYMAVIDITFEDCDVDVERIDSERHYVSPDHRFEIKNFRFNKYTRKVNHIVAYLDRITVYDRIANDDVSISEMLENFTLAQITEFIKIANEKNASNVMAVLLEYKNAHYADFDPMEEFTLDW